MAGERNSLRARWRSCRIDRRDPVAFNDDDGRRHDASRDDIKIAVSLNYDRFSTDGRARKYAKQEQPCKTLIHDGYHFGGGSGNFTNGPAGALSGGT